jgi:uncharacterized protein (DUF983 family)
MFSGILTMRRECPVCGYRFERSPGFFVGAMYASYALAVPLCAAIYMLLRRLLPACPPWGIVLLLFVCIAPLTPLLFRYSRSIWIHMMWSLDPEEPDRPR